MILIIDNYPLVNEPSKATRILEAIQPAHGRIISYREISQGIPSGTTGIILSGSPGRINAVLHTFKDESDLVRKTSLPLLGICFGHQLLGAAFGGRIGSLGAPVRGLRVITVVERDPLLQGWELMTQHYVRENHWDYLETLPKGFKYLAKSSDCAYEIIRHETKPLWGVQFHPEYKLVHAPTPRYTEGSAILANFIALTKHYTEKSISRL